LRKRFIPAGEILGRICLSEIIRHNAAEKAKKINSFSYLFFCYNIKENNEKLTISIKKIRFTYESYL